MAETSVRTPSPRVAHKRQQARREILDAAERVLGAGGTEAVTLASVADQLGMTKQALYHYFPSKEALLRSLVTTLLDEEIEALGAAMSEPGFEKDPLGNLIRAFYAHYSNRLDAFRTIYCQSQLCAVADSGLDETTLRDEVHPRTRSIFDRLEDQLAGPNADVATRRHARQLAYTAWCSALGLMTILGVADATDDQLIHSDQELLDTLAGVFRNAVG
jgi:AcrR family transcriptional regulator